MNAVLDLLFSVSGVVVTLLVGALWLWRRPQSTAARRFLLTTAVFYTLASIYVAPRTIGRLLTLGYHRFTPTDVPSGTTALVVLGAGDQVVGGWDESVTVPNMLGAARVLETWRVFRLLNPAWVISSGGGAEPAGPLEPSAITMRDALVRLGVPPTRIKLESTSRNTHEEAVLVTAMLPSLDVQHLIVVTSDIHMRRSIAAFRAQGSNPIPAIAPDPRATIPRYQRWTPHRHGLSYTAEVVHELVGIVYYWARGWWR
jgi:uncharacterized SAM-binding protein YcdF (DUF218 family)